MNWLRERREELNLNQDDIAARLQLEGVNITRSTVSNWEKGKYNMPMNDPAFRKALAVALRLSEREVLARSGYDIGQKGHSDAAERAADIVDQISSPDQQKLAIRLLEQFLEPG